MITLTGLTDKQIVLCNIMWDLETQESVNAFIKSLPRADAKECISLCQLMIMELADECTDTDQAQSILNQFKL